MFKLFKRTVFFLFASLSIPAYAQIDSVFNRVLLVGDAGMLEGGTHPQLNLMKKVFNLDDKKNTVLFLGDNIYPLGLPSVFSDAYEAKKRFWTTRSTS